MAVLFDAVGPGAAGSVAGTAAAPVTTATWSHTVGVGTGRYLLVGVSGGSTASATATVTVTYGGVTVPLLTSVVPGGGGAGQVYLFGLANPASGTANVVVTSSAATTLTGGSTSYSGVGGVGTPVTAAGSSGAPAVSVTGTATGSMVAAHGGSGIGFTAAGQTLRYRATGNANSSAGNSQGSTAAGGGTVTFTDTTSGDDWGMIAVELKAAATTPTTATDPTSGGTRTAAPQGETRWAPLAQLVDRFSDAATTTGIWAKSYSGGASFTPQALGGRGRVPAEQNGTGTPYYAGFQSQTVFRLRGSAVSAQVPTVAQPNGAASGKKVTTELVVASAAQAAGTRLMISVDTVTGLLSFETQVGYNDPNKPAYSVTYVAATHQWWRIADDGTNTTFATSPDSVTWTIQRTIATPAWSAATDHSLEIGSWREAGTNDYSEFDNVNAAVSNVVVSDATSGGVRVGRAGGDTVAVQAVSNVTAADPSAGGVRVGRSSDGLSVDVVLSDPTTGGTRTAGPQGETLYAGVPVTAQDPTAGGTRTGSGRDGLYLGAPVTATDTTTGGTRIGRADGDTAAASTVPSVALSDPTTGGTRVGAAVDLLPIGALFDAFTGTGLGAQWPTQNGAGAQGGELYVNCAQNAGAPVYSAARSAPVYTLAGSALVVQVAAFPAQAGTDTASAQVWVMDSAPAATVDRLGWEYVAATNSLVARSQTGANYTATDYKTLPYDPTVHRWLRVAHSGTAITWATSPDGLTWTTQATLNTPPTWTAKTTLQASLEAFRTTGTNDTFRVAKVNVPQVPLPTSAPSGSDALQTRTLSEVRAWEQWLTTAGAKGWIGEFGAVTVAGYYGDPVQQAQWNALVDVALTEMDWAGLSGTVWASGRQWSSTYTLGVDVSSTGQGGALDTTRGYGTQILASHPSRGGFRRGVNLSGWENGTTTSGPNTVRTATLYVHTAADFQYLAAQGRDTVRLAVAWEILQPTLGAALSTTALATLDGMLAAARQYGIRVVIDLHCYGWYTRADGTAVSVSGGGITDAQFSDFWTRLSTWVQATASRSQAVHAYDLANEPNTLVNGAAGWQTTSQAALTAIRNNNDTRLVLVPGYNFSSLTDWTKNHPTGWVTDPAGNYAYTAHWYWDTQSVQGARSGTYQESNGSGGQQNERYLTELSAAGQLPPETSSTGVRTAAPGGETVVAQASNNVTRPDPPTTAGVEIGRGLDRVAIDVFGPDPSSGATRNGRGPDTLFLGVPVAFTDPATGGTRQSWALGDTIAVATTDPSSGGTRSGAGPDTLIVDVIRLDPGSTAARVGRAGGDGVGVIVLDAAAGGVETNGAYGVDTVVGATSGPLSALPILRVLADFTTNAPTIPAPVAGGTTVDLTATMPVTTVKTSRGRQYELGTHEAGTATIQFQDKQELLNPANPTSPYNTGAAAIRSFRPVRVRALWAGQLYDLFTGYIERFPQTWKHGGSHGVKPMECVDVLGILANLPTHQSYYDTIMADAPTLWIPMVDTAGPGSVFLRSPQALVSADQSLPGNPRQGTSAYYQESLLVGGTGLRLEDESANGGNLHWGGGRFLDGSAAVQFSASKQSGDTIATGGINRQGAVDIAGGAVSVDCTNSTIEYWYKFTAGVCAFSVFQSVADGNFDLPNSSNNWHIGAVTIAGQLVHQVVIPGVSCQAGYTSVTDGFPDDQWHHVVIRFSTLSAGTYQVSFTFDGYTTSRTFGGTPYRLGANSIRSLAQTYWGDQTSSGEVFGIAYYPYPLSDAQVRTHYMRGNGYSGETAQDRAQRLLRTALQGAQVTPSDGIAATTVGPDHSYGVYPVVTDQTSAARSSVRPVSVLTAIQEVDAAERGQTFADASGTVRVESRKFRSDILPLSLSIGFQVNAGWDTTQPWPVLGDRPDLGELPYIDIEFDYDPTYVYTQTQLTKSLGAHPLIQTSPAQATFGQRAFTQTVSLRDDWDLVQLGMFILQRYGVQVLRVRTVKLDPAASPSLWPFVLGLEISRPVRVNRRTSTGLLMSGLYWVEKIAHDIESARNKWETHLQLSPMFGNGANPGLVNDGNAAPGVAYTLGVDTVAVY